AQPDLAAEYGNLDREPVRERREAAPVVCQHLRTALAATAAAKLELVPEPYGGDLGRERSELSFEQRLPHHAIDALASEPNEPFLSGLVFERAPVLDAARTQGQDAEPNAVHERERGEPEDVDRRAEPEDVVREVHPGARRPIDDAVVLAQLPDELVDVKVVGEPMMVELLQP